MTRRSVSLSRVVWWAGLTTLAVALMPLTLWAHARADADPSAQDSFKHCTPKELQSATCEAPGNCINACANKCGTGTACLQCCAAFSSSEPDYKACRQLCTDVWGSIPG